jgi:hypothetical protein
MSIAELADGESLTTATGTNAGPDDDASESADGEDTIGEEEVVEVFGRPPSRRRHHQKCDS